jgi:hypothetical protein
MNSQNTNNYQKQKERALKRKKELIELKGGKCSICGYNKNYAAIEFHHLDPSVKEFVLDSRMLSNTTSEKILKEIEKCIIICSNCHKELHYPHLEKDNIKVLLETFNTRNNSVFKNKYKTTICDECGKEYKYVKGKRFCSNKCQWDNRKKKYNYYPTNLEVEEKYKVLKSWDKVAKFYDLSRSIIKGIRKRGF